MVDIAIGLLVAIVIVAATTYYLMIGRSSASSENKNEQQAFQKIKEEATETKKEKPNNNTNLKKKNTTKAPRTHRPKPPSHPRFHRRFGGHSNNITSMAVSPNGEWMATSGLDSQIRLSRVEKDHPHEFVLHMIEDHDRVTNLSWETDGRTVACGMSRSGHVRFYRVRMKKGAEGDNKNNQQKHSVFPYELVELPKRRFPTSSKLDNVSACVADRSCSTFHLVLTSGESAAQHGQKVAAAWDGKAGSGESLAVVKTGGGDVRLSQDGQFFCGRGGGGSMSEVKIFEVHRKKVKGDVEPHFDKITPKSVMTLCADAKVMDVAFLYTDHVCDRAVVCTADGDIQLWSLNVEYRLQEDPKLLCSTKVEKEIVSIDSSFDANRFAVVTRDNALRVFTCSASSESKQFINLDFTIDGCHADGVGDVNFCPLGKFVYTRSAAGKDVFSWKV